MKQEKNASAFFDLLGMLRRNLMISSHLRGSDKPLRTRREPQAGDEPSGSSTDLQSKNPCGFFESGGAKRGALCHKENVFSRLKKPYLRPAAISSSPD